MQSQNGPTTTKKVQWIDPVNKENQKLYFLVKSKTNLSTNWKTKLKQGAKWSLKQYVERKGKNRYVVKYR